MEKNIYSVLSEHIPNDEELQLINKYTVSELSADDLFVFNVVLCDNEIDRDAECFDTAALETLSELYVGKSGIFDHSMSGKDQVARVYKTELCTDGRKNSLGNDYYYLKAGAYMVKTPENAALISEIKAGIKKEVSVNCSVEGIYCSVCGENIRERRCSHKKGRHYDGKLCFGIMKHPKDAYEWSFVAVPAQPGAGVIKSFSIDGKEANMESILKNLREAGDSLTLDKKEIGLLVKAFEKLDREAADGRAYREELEAQTVRLGLISVPKLASVDLKDICKKLSVDELKNLRKAFSEEAGKKVPISSQFKSSEIKNNSNTEFKI